MRGALRIRVMGKSIRGRVSKVVSEGVADTSRKFFLSDPDFRTREAEAKFQTGTRIYDELKISILFRHFFRTVKLMNILFFFIYDCYIN